jgi:hypothetical protein
MPVRNQQQRRIAMTVTAYSRGGTDQLLDLVRSQVLAAPNGSIRNPLGRRFPQSRDTDTRVAASATTKTVD